jgi:hypothetical protein
MNKEISMYHRKPSVTVLIWSFVLVVSYFGLYELSQILGWSKDILRFSSLILLVVFIFAVKFIKLTSKK